jgi:hypothetical protein
MSASITSSQIATPEAPWLGLRSFTEDAQEYFFGRSAELEDLYERILDKPLTILFGQSGLGKSSLLQAALIPRLRAGGFLPVLVRFSHDPHAASLQEQMIEQLKEALIAAECHEQVGALLTARDGATRSDWDPTAFLWLLFHDPIYRFIPRAGESAASLLRPVFLIDQFEEIFTLGERPDRRLVSLTFRDALASLVENRPPPSLRSRLEEDDELVGRLVYQARHMRSLLSLREDFLHVLERWHRAMPSLMENRFELRMLSGPQAFEAVVRPGQLRSAALPIIPDEVGEAIVRFVAGARDDVPLAEIDAVPPLLSLVCAELNAQRLSAGEQQITRAQFEGHSDEILQSFYLRSFDLASYGGALENISNADVALKAAQRLIEDRLLSPDGYRESIAFDTIARDLSKAATPNAAKAVLDEIVARRLLTLEERGGVRRLELAHDVLAPIVKASRDERQEKEALASAKRDQERAEAETRRALVERNRLRRLAITAAFLALIAVLAGVFGVLGMIRAHREAKRAEAGFASAFNALNSLYHDFSMKTVGNVTNTRFEETVELKSRLNTYLVQQLQTLYEDRPAHNPTRSFLAQLYMEEARLAMIQEDGARAARSIAKARSYCIVSGSMSQAQVELNDEILMRGALAESYSRHPENALVQASQQLKTVEEHMSQWPTSWRLPYISGVLRNLIIFHTEDDPQAYLKLSAALYPLIEKSGRDFDTVLMHLLTLNNGLTTSDKHSLDLGLLEEELSSIDEYLIQPNNYTLFQIEYATDRVIKKFIVSALRPALIARSASDEPDCQRRLLLKTRAIVDQLKKKLPKSPIGYATRGELLDTEIKLAQNGIKIQSSEELDAANKEHLRIASAMGVPESIRDSINRLITQYAAPRASADEKQAALKGLDDLMPHFMALQLPEIELVFRGTELANKILMLRNAKPNDPLVASYDRFVERGIDLFLHASKDMRLIYIESFSERAQVFAEKQFKQRLFSQVASHWERAYGDIDVAALSSGDKNGLVMQATWAAQSFINLGQIQGGIDVWQRASKLSERILKERPWDWYVRQAAIGLHFEVANSLEAASQNEHAELLRRKGWRMLVEMTGADIDLTKFKVLPKKGDVPSGATADEAKFFSSFKSVEQGGSSMKMFVIPCDVNGDKVPVQFYILSGKAGYQGLLDQFRWIKEFRGVDVPTDVQDSLKKLNEIAVENKVDFLELCKYALNYPTDNKDENKEAVPKTTPQERLQAALDGIKSAEAAYRKAATDENKIALAQAYDAAADSAMYVRRWKDVETWARKSLELTSSDGNGHGNLATALLFQGKYADALKIFRAHWNDPLGDGTLGEAAYSDFEQLEKAGITHPDLARLRAALPAPTPRPAASAAPPSE